MFDLIIRGGQVIDGTGRARQRADIGVANDPADATGIDHVICNGSVIVSHGVFSDTRPGTLLHSGRNTASPDLG